MHNLPYPVKLALVAIKLYTLSVFVPYIVKANYHEYPVKIKHMQLTYTPQLPLAESLPPPTDRAIEQLVHAKKGRETQKANAFAKSVSPLPSQYSQEKVEITISKSRPSLQLGASKRAESSTEAVSLKSLSIEKPTEEKEPILITKPLVKKKTALSFYELMDSLNLLPPIYFTSFNKYLSHLPMSAPLQNIYVITSHIYEKIIKSHQIMV